MISFIAQSDRNGTEVRWYVIYRDWHEGHRPIISASKNGVLVMGYIDRIPEQIYDAAHEVARTLRRNPRANVDGYATHQVIRHDLVPIDRQTGCNCAMQCRGQQCECLCHDIEPR